VNGKDKCSKEEEEGSTEHSDKAKTTRSSTITDVSESSDTEVYFEKIRAELQLDKEININESIQSNPVK